MQNARNVGEVRRVAHDNKNRHDKHGGFMVNLMNVIYRIIPFLQADSSLGLSVRIPLRRGLREFFLLLLP